MALRNDHETGSRAHQPVGVRAALFGSILTALALVGLAHYANLYDWVKAPDAWSYDWRTAHFAFQPERARQDILVVTIDETSLDKYRWISPVNRALTAKLVKGLEAAGAKAVGLDLVFDKPTEPSDDKALTAVLKTSAIPIVLGSVDSRSVLRDRDPDKALAFQESFIASSGQSAGHLYFFSSARHGSFNVGDQVIRWRLGASPVPPHRQGFATVLAEKAGYIVNVPDVSEPRLIDWQRPPRRGLEQHAVPELRVKSHEPDESIDAMFGEGWQDLVRGRIVLVGGSFGDRDRHLTPFSVIDGKTVPGVFIHAQILSQLIDGREVLTLPKLHETLLLAALVVFGWLLARRTWSFSGASSLAFRPDAGAIGVSIAAGFIVFLAGVAVYAATAYIIPSATIFLAFVAGLLLGNPPFWLAWVLSKLGVYEASQQPH